MELRRKSIDVFGSNDSNQQCYVFLNMSRNGTLTMVSSHSLDRLLFLRGEEDSGHGGHGQGDDDTREDPELALVAFPSRHLESLFLLELVVFLK